MHKQVKVQTKQRPKHKQWYIQNTVPKTKDWETRIPHKKRMWTQLPRKGKEFLLHWYKSKLIHLFLLFLLLCKKYSPCSWIHLRYIPIHNFHWLVSSSLTFDCTPQCRRVPSVNFVAIISDWYAVLTIEDSDAYQHWNVCYVSLYI